jgi:type 1 fimbria pilin
MHPGPPVPTRLPKPILRHLTPILVTLCLSLTAHEVRAAVTDCTASLPLTVNLQTVSVPTNLAAGQAIPGARGNFTVTENCINNTPTGAVSWYLTDNSVGTFTLVPGFQDVYTRTGMVAGVGLRVRDRNGTALQPISYGGATSTFVLGPAVTGVSQVSGTFELVRTAATVGSGTSAITTYMHVHTQVYGNQNQSSSQISLNYTIAPTTVPACSVTQQVISVNLPSVSASSLPATGATSGGSAFTIGLNCEANSHPNISMSDGNMLSNTTATLTLAPASTARGVGVQVQYGGQAITFGPSPFSYINGTAVSANSVSLGQRSGTVQIPFTARYVRNGTLQVGSVQAMATFLLSYQ